MAVAKSSIINNNLFLIIDNQRFRIDTGEWTPQDEIEEGWTQEQYLGWYKSMLDHALAKLYEVEWDNNVTYG